MKKITLIFTQLLFTVFVFSQDLSQNLLLYYPFDGNTNDISGNGYNGTPFNITYGPDKFGNPMSAAYFNGIDSYMNFPNIAALKPQLPMSFAFRIKYTSESYHNQVVFNTSFEEDHCTGVWFNASLMNNGHAANYGNGAYSYSPSTRRTLLCIKEIVVDSWHQVVIVMNSATDMKIYINCFNYPGTYSGTGGALVYSPTPGNIGRHDRDLTLPPDYFQGYIDEFRYWDRALDPAEVAAICETLSVEENPIAADSFVVYPNPADDKLNIETRVEDIQSVSIYNAVGQNVYEAAYSPEVDVTNFPVGLYYVRITGDSGILTKKIMIK